MGISVEVDLSRARNGAQIVRTQLLELGEQYDLERIEYCRRVRVAPLEIPHSHPVVTLSTMERDALGVLATYIHEQMHWYTTWFSQTASEGWKWLFVQLKRKYPDAPAMGSGQYHGTHTTYLHLPVNWLEIDCTSHYIDRSQVTQRVRKLRFYQWCYENVLKDWRYLQGLYKECDLLPVKPATEMTVSDLQLAAKPPTSPVHCAH